MALLKIPILLDIAVCSMYQAIFFFFKGALKFHLLKAIF